MNLLTNRLGFGRLALALALTTLICGCGGKKDAASELADTAKILEQSPAAAPSTSTAVNQSATLPARQVNEALGSLKAGNYADAIGSMEKARSNPNKTPQQMMAIQDAMAALMRDLYTRAGKGDVAAKQAIEKYQAERNRR